MTRIALLGFGTVDSAVARRLFAGDPSSAPPLFLTHIFDRRADGKRRSAGVAAAAVWTSRIEDVLAAAIVPPPRLTSDFSLRPSLFSLHVPNINLAEAV